MEHTEESVILPIEPDAGLQWSYVYIEARFNAAEIIIHPVLAC